MNINATLGNLKYTNKLKEGYVSNKNKIVLKLKTDNSNLLTKQDYCRLCAILSPIDALVPIADSSGNTKYELMLEICLPGTFKENDKYPRMICSSCINKLEECYKIIISFMRADKIIRKIFNSRLKACINTKINTPTIIQGADYILPDNSLIKKQTETADPLSLLTIKKKEIYTEGDPLSLETVSKKETDDPLSIDLVVDNSTQNKNIQHSLHNEKPKSSEMTKNQIIESEEKLEIKYQCLTCLKLFNNKKKVTDHSLSTHPTKDNKENVFRIVMAKLRKKKSNEILNNKNNMVNITNDLFEHKYQCVQCYKLFINKLEFYKHSAEIHSTQNGKIVCKLVKIKKTNNEEKPSKEHPTFVKYGNLVRPSYQPIRITKSQSIPESIFNFTTNENNETKTSEPTVTFQIKYQCKNCSTVFNTYKEVLDHSEQLHQTLKEVGAVASLVKVKDTVTNAEQNSENNLVICVNDGTIIEVDPNVKPERRKLKYSAPITAIESRFKCMICSKLFVNKKMVLEHSLSAHPTEPTRGWNEMNCKMVIVTRELSYKPKIRTTYECLICSSNHCTKVGLIQHTRVFHSSISKDKFLCRFIDPKNKQFKECLRCNAVLKSYTRYRKHMSKHASFRCEQCGLNLDTLSDLRVHLKTHEEPKPIKETYKCIICETEFTSKIQLKKHKPIHNILKDVSCSKCNKPFTSELELKKHEQVHDTRVCDVCGKTFDAKYIHKHRQTHNIDRPYKCKSCPRTFKTQHMLWTHQRAHVSGPRHMMCQVCGKVMRKGYLNAHMRIHTGDKPEVCDICGVRFGRKDHLRNHLKTHMEDRSNPCPICNIPLYGNQSYWSHMFIMHGEEKPEPGSSKLERPFTCVICQKHFSQKCYLQDHFRRHTGQKICSCKVCGKEFASKIHLWQHKFSHMDYDQLPYKCEYCDKKFKRSEHLRNHRRIHTGEKPFPCPICQRPFRVRAEMVKHTRIHKRKEERVTRKKSSKASTKTVNKTEEFFYVDDSNSSVE